MTHTVKNIRRANVAITSRKGPQNDKVTRTQRSATVAETKGAVAPWGNEIGQGDCYESTEPDLWFSNDHDELIRAQSICGSCQIASTCLSIAVKRKESGMWGGMLLDRGKIIDIPARKDIPA